MTSQRDAPPPATPWQRAVGEAMRFAADRYGRNGSLNEAGGAHFFYGNTIDLDAGAYSITVAVEKPFGVGLPDVQLEALDWTSPEPAIAAVSKFFVGADSHAFLATLVLRLAKAAPVEIRGWSGSSATLLDFRQAAVQRIETASLETAAASLGAGATAPFLQQRQLWWEGGAGGEPWFISPIAAHGASRGRWELVQGEGQALCGKAGSEMWCFALPDLLFEGAALLVLSAGAELFVLSEAGAIAAPVPNAAPGATASQPAPDLTAPVARLLRSHEETTARLEQLETGNATAIAQLRATLSEAVADIAGWRHQIPNLLNAISSAQAAAGIVARAGLWEEPDRPSRAEFAALQAELNALRQDRRGH